MMIQVRYYLFFASAVLLAVRGMTDIFFVFLSIWTIQGTLVTISGQRVSDRTELIPSTVV